MTLDVINGVAEEIKALTRIKREEAFIGLQRVRQLGIQTPSGQVLPDLFLGSVQNQFGTRIEFFGRTLMRGGALHAQPLAVESCSSAVKTGIFLRNQFGRRVVVLYCEVDLFLAFFRDRHRGNDRVEFLGQQRGDHAVPLLLDQCAFAIQPFTDFHRHVDVKSF